MGRSFAEKLDRLFATIRRSDGSPFSIAEVAAAVSETSDVTLSASYLSELRSGRKDNPNIWVAYALAQFFGQPIEYFVEDLDPVVVGSRSATPNVGGELGSVAERVKVLVQLSGPHGIADPTSAQLPRWMRHDGYEVSVAQLDEIRSGERDVADPVVVSALAGYFDVPAAFITDASVAKAMAPELRLVKAMKDQGLRRLAMRAHQLDAVDRERVTDLIERLAGDRGSSAGDIDF